MPSLTIATEFLRKLDVADTDDAFRSVLADTAHGLGFRYYAMIHHDDLAVQQSWHVNICDYPEAITARIVGTRLDRRDPVIRGCAFAESAFVWSDLHRIITLDNRDRQKLAFGIHEGLNEGVTVPCWSRNDCLGSCTFAGLQSIGDAIHLRGAVQLIGVFGFQHARRIRFGGDPAPAPRPRLNPRPRDCVVLAGRGLSNKQIAKSLGLTPSTVNGYLNEARALFGATSRTELVIGAIFAGEINLHELRRVNPDHLTGMI
jgi:DNA-binding CsgD family transcriptional regulator